MMKIKVKVELIIDIDETRLKGLDRDYTDFALYVDQVIEAGAKPYLNVKSSCSKYEVIDDHIDRILDRRYEVLVDLS